MWEDLHIPHLPDEREAPARLPTKRVGMTNWRDGDEKCMLNDKKHRQK